MKKAIGKWIERRTIKRLRRSIGREVWELLLKKSEKLMKRNMFPKILDAGSGKDGSWDYGTDSAVTKADLCYGNDFNKPLVFMDNEFDIIVCAGVIQYLTETSLFMTELHRILKPGGVLIMATVNNKNWLRRLGLVKPTMKKDEWVLFTRQSLEMFINKFGFKTEKAWGIDIINLPTDLCSNICIKVTKPK